MYYTRKSKGVFLGEDQYVEGIQFDGDNWKAVKEFVGNGVSVYAEGKTLMLKEKSSRTKIQIGDYITKTDNGYLEVFDEVTFNNLYLVQ